MAKESILNEKRSPVDVYFESRLSPPFYFSGAIVAGGAVVCDMIGLPVKDIDVFFYGKRSEAEQSLQRTIGQMVLEGWTPVALPVESKDGKAYLHLRVVMKPPPLVAVPEVDLIWNESWETIDDVLYGFDLTCCQVGITDTGRLIGTPEGLRSLMTRTFWVTSNAWPTTPARVQKYIERGFREVAS